MWTSPRLLRLLLLFVAGCGSPETQEPTAQAGSPPSGASSGGTSAAGSATGGAVAGGGAANGAAAAQGGGGSGGTLATGGAACDTRWKEYYALAQSARLCDPNAAMPECKFDVVVLDSCGCSVPANPSSPDYLPARQRLTKYAEDCDFPEQCSSCPATLQAGCVNDGGVNRCVYQ